MKNVRQPNSKENRDSFAQSPTLRTMAVLHCTAHTISDAAHSVLVWPSEERLQTKDGRLSTHSNRIFQQAMHSLVALRAEWKEASLGTSSVYRRLVWTPRLLYGCDKVIISTRNGGRAGNTLALSKNEVVLWAS